MNRFLRPFASLLLLLVLVAGALYLFRGPLLRRLGVSLPTGAASRTAITLPDGLSSTLFAEGLRGPRFMTLGPDGVLYVAERGANRVVALPDRDGDGRADEIIEVAGDLDSPSSLAFRPGSTELYVGERSRVTRLTLDGFNVPAREVVVSDLPSRQIHITTTVLFGSDGGLYLSRGSSCNVCEENDPRLAALWRYEPDGSGGRLVMRGLRNAVGMTLGPDGAIWLSNMGRDLLGDDLPPETIYRAEEGADAGWPRCHAGTLPDPDFGTGAGACDGVAMPVVTMQAHSAPLALLFYEGTLLPADYRGDLFVAFHGSWNRSVPTGYSVVRVPMEGATPTGPAEPFATGWLRADNSNTGRPAGLVVAADGALLLSDDAGGYIYRIAPTR